MRYIYARLIGGLGNQMFQYAAARALALRQKAEVRLDLSGFENYGLRRYELDPYPIAATIATNEEIEAFKQPVAEILRQRARGLLDRVLGSTPRPIHYREPHFHFDPQLAKQTPPVLLDGFWQSELYFRDIAGILRTELAPRDPLEAENAALAAEIDQVEAVSLHVRRGDYVSNTSTNAYHGVCSLDYYRAAITRMREHLVTPHLFVFSDDHAWARDNLKAGVAITYVTVNPSDRGFRDMQLMSRCRHHIIANSSFSWWGAWLNPRPNKIVVAPNRWFAASPNDTRDLLPLEWSRL